MSLSVIKRTHKRTRDRRWLNLILYSHRAQLSVKMLNCYLYQKCFAMQSYTPFTASFSLFGYMSGIYLKKRLLEGFVRLTLLWITGHWLPQKKTWKKTQRTNGPVKSSPDIWAKHKIKFGSKWPNHFWEKPVLIFKRKWPWAKVKKWPWPSILAYLHYPNWFQVTGCKSSEKSTVFTFSYRIKLCYQIWPCRKIGQGQPRIIIWTNYDGQESSMRHTKFRGNQSTGSEEEDFEGFLPYMGMGAILVMWPPSCQ